MALGIQVRLTSTGLSASNILIDDIRAESSVGRRGLAPEYVYIPAPTTTTPNPTITLTYGGTVPMSYARGDIRGLIDRGYITAEFLIDDLLLAALAGIVAIVATAGAPTPDEVTGGTGDLLYLVDSTNDTVNITLVPGATHATGHFRVIDLAGMASTNPITVTAAVGETVNGAASYTLSLDHGATEFFWDEAGDWFIPAGGYTEFTPVAPVATPYAAAPGEFVEVTTGGAAFTVLLPNPGSPGDRITVKKVDAGVGIMTLDSNGGPNIDGAATYPVGVQWQAVSVIRGTAQWLVE